MSLPASPNSRISAPPDVAALKGAAQAARLHKSSRQFEAVFVEQMLQQMRKTTLSSGLFTGGVEKDIYNSFMDQAVADKVASRGGFGLGAMVERTLAARQKNTAAHGGARPGSALPLHAAPAAPIPLTPAKAISGLPSVETSAAPAVAAPAGDPCGAHIEATAAETTVADPAPSAPMLQGSLAARIELGGGPPAPSLSKEAHVAATDAARIETPSVIAAPAARMAVEPDPGPLGSAPAPVRASSRTTAEGGRAHPLDPAIESASREFGVDARLLKAVLLTESGGRSGAVSPSGAVGLMQLMPDTARAMGVRNVFDPMENLRGGARYLSQLLHRFGGSITQALAAYNAGPGTVARHGGVPPYPETRQYVARVLRERRRLAGA